MIGDHFSISRRSLRVEDAIQVLATVTRSLVTYSPLAKAVDDGEPDAVRNFSTIEKESVTRTDRNHDSYYISVRLVSVNVTT